MSSRNSVQFSLLKMVLKIVGSEGTTVISPFIPNDKMEYFRSTPNVIAISLSNRKLALRFLYKMFERNEAMLWAISWLIESLFRGNSSIIVAHDVNAHSKVVNLAYTLPLPSDLYWNQATPPLKTLQMMKANPIAPILAKTLGPVITILDDKLMTRHKNLTKKIVNNSDYLKETYRGKKFYSKEVLHVPKEFPSLTFENTAPTQDYVLAYIGKEIEVEVLLEMVKLGIKIVAFGSKIPFGTPLGKLKQKVDFRGYVEESELSILYRNALYTAFPFTEEPFGWVPLESMFYGTPVLSYNKQGPAETIIDQKTGWLVDNRNEFLQKALSIWKGKFTGMDSESCMERAKYFSLENAKIKLNEILTGV